MLLQIALLVFALLAVKLIKIQWIKRRNARKAVALECKPPPTAKSRGLFGIGTLVQSIKATNEERGVQWIKNEFDVHSTNTHTIQAFIFDYQLILTRDVENVKAMFASQSHEFDIGPHREKTFKDLFGLGVMTGRGQKWKHSRGLIRPQFAREQVTNLALFEPHVQALIRRLYKSPGQWSDEVDMGPLFYNLSLDVATEFLIGQSVHTQDPTAQELASITADPTAPRLASFGPALDGAKATLDRRGAMAKYGWLLRFNDYPQNCKTVQDFVMWFVHRTLAHTDEEKLSHNMSGKFVLLHELAKETRDPLTLRNEMLNVLHAARDTVAALMGWVFYFLARREDIWIKLRQEIDRALPNKTPEEITFKKLWDIHYLVQVVNETIRFIGIVPMNERAAVVDTTLPRGGGPDGQSPVFVPKGTQVLIPTYAMQHREDIWGADVEEYRPERWEGRKFGWDFVPFGGGARQCIGQQFARTEAMYTIVRLLQTFDKIQNMEYPLQPIRFHHTIENRSGTGIHIKLHAAE